MGIGEEEKVGMAEEEVGMAEEELEIKKVGIGEEENVEVED